ncbi:MAG: tRNA pseudouridine synthase A, partial [Deltaproteobacteria bacterium]|nr:tRNA pseudouridine synthase A [Deltaproteobacteria bacterium]
MRNVKLIIEYEGTAYAGWQIQPGVRTIQEVLEEKLAVILRHPARAAAAGRTDAGVHARGQVVSFATSSSLAPERIRSALTSMLGPEVVAVDALVAAAGFDARFSASARVYRYVVDTAEVPDPFT